MSWVDTVFSTMHDASEYQYNWLPSAVKHAFNILCDSYEQSCGFVYWHIYPNDALLKDLGDAGIKIMPTVGSMKIWCVTRIREVLGVCVTNSFPVDLERDYKLMLLTDTYVTNIEHSYCSFMSFISKPTLVQFVTKEPITQSQVFKYSIGYQSNVNVSAAKSVADRLAWETFKRNTEDDFSFEEDDV